MERDSVLLVARWAAEGGLSSAHGPLAVSLDGERDWRDALDRCLDEIGPAMMPSAGERRALAAALGEGGQSAWADGRGGTVRAFLDAIAGGGTTLTIVHRTPHSALGPELLREVMDILPATVSVKDADRRYLFVNRSWEAYAGVPAEAVIGHRHEEFSIRTVAEANRDAHSGDIADRDGLVLATGRPLMGQEERYRTVDGDERTLLSNKMPLTGRDGRPVGILSVTVDITDRKRAEALLRTAKEVAEAASVTKSNFLATISHELRTPLNGIVGMNEMLLMTALDETQRRWAEVALECARQLTTLVEEIIDIASIDSGRMRLLPEDVDIAALAEDVGQRHAPAAEARGLSLTVVVEVAARRWVRADRTRLRQILDNLVGNAVKFTEAGSVLLTVDGVGDDKGVLHLTATVADTGIGIPADALPHIFTMFHQVDASTTRRHAGTGIGLAITRRLTEMMGGTISVDSEPAHGSVFRVSLPLRLAVPPAGAGLGGTGAARPVSRAP